ncbi:hypothetical protein B0H17DRAFT_1146415 [Mycena rosella]|uniref:Uncharacterized protein n=1 Tax=Mycena rosella TaxID=1033263 RepID=A0AAD7G1E8_MYCRO|nr:hypothetical protein B0H17DRAFT_1146415 [Mycena rosella]
MSSPSTPDLDAPPECLQEGEPPLVRSPSSTTKQKIMKNSNDDDNEEMRDFIVSDNDEIGRVLPDSKPKSKNKSRVDLPSKNTRSHSKAVSDSNGTSSKTDTVCGKQSPFSKFGSAPSENQKKLEVRPSSKSVSISTSEYEAFKQYLANQGDSSGPTLGSAFKQKSKGASKINNAESKAKTVSTSRKPAKGWVYLDDDDEGAPDVDIPSSDKLKRQASKKGASQLSKRKHEIPDHENLDEDEQPPKKKPSKSMAVTNTKHALMDSEDELECVPAPSTPKKLASAVRGKGKAVKSAKKVKIEEEEKVLETTTVLKVKSLPAECEVTNLDLQDPALAEAGVYDSLPPLQ